MPAWTYRASLDGLRTLAVYLVVLFHAGVPWSGGGFIGVDLFFVLSGFLVTNVILSEVDATGRVELRRFYARRVRRLMPAAIVAIVGTSAIFVLVASVARRSEMIADAQAALLYVANWRYVVTSSDYFAADASASPFLHYWSLSIEEQFYVLFPLLVVALLGLGRRWALPVGIGILTVASVGAQLYWGAVDPVRAYFGTDARAYQLLAGALLALGWRRLASRGVPRWAGMTATAAGLAIFLVLTVPALADVSQSVRGLVATTAAVVMISGLMATEDQPLSRLLSLRPAVYLGTISYATYLWHWPLVLVLEEVLDARPEVLALLVAVAATGLAALSSELLETPIRTTTRLARHAWPVVAVGVAACVVAALVVVPRTLEVERRPVLAKSSGGVSPEVVRALGSADGGLEAIPDDIDWRALGDDNGVRVQCPPDRPEDCVVREGDGAHVLLVGDSQAGMLTDAFIALAEDHDLTLSLNVVGGCPWQEGLHNHDAGRVLEQRCTQSRVGWYDEALPELAPDLVVVVSRARVGGRWSDRMRRRDGVPQDLTEATLEATRATVEAIRRSGAEVALVDQIITPGRSQPRDCLSLAAISAECVVMAPRDRPVTDAVNAAVAIGRGGVHVVDFNLALCPGYPACAPVVDGQVVYSDPLHVTASHAVQRRAALWKDLVGTGALG